MVKKADARGLAKDENTPCYILAELAQDDDEYIRYLVALNHNATLEIFNILIKDESENVRWAITQNQSTPIEILVKLAEDTSEYVLVSLVDNPKLPAAVKLWLDRGGYAGMTLAEFVEKVDNGLL